VAQAHGGVVGYGLKQIMQPLEKPKATLISVALSARIQ
jgi:hypothetical protein